LDENFQTYLNRAMRMTLPGTYRSQVQNIQESPKFQWHPEKGLQATPFPGYTIVTPPGHEDDPVNQPLYAELEKFQKQILNHLGAHTFATVPLSSFHLTLADLIWDSAYRHAAEDKEFGAKLRDRIASIFRDCELLSEGKPIRFQAISLMVMTRAVGICLAPTDEASYDRILKFRRALYQNRDLIGLGIEQQYYFTPHITLGYFGKLPPLEERWELGNTFIALNQQWLDGNPQEFYVQRAELRQFEDMTAYRREPDWPTFKF
jgi:hypothetical protein